VTASMADDASEGRDYAPSFSSGVANSFRMLMQHWVNRFTGLYSSTRVGRVGSR
jgi:hypothetical protein